MQHVLVKFCKHWIFCDDICNKTIRNMTASSKLKRKYMSQFWFNLFRQRWLTFSGGSKPTYNLLDLTHDWNTLKHCLLYVYIIPVYHDGNSLQYWTVISGQFFLKLEPINNIFSPGPLNVTARLMWHVVTCPTMSHWPESTV